MNDLVQIMKIVEGADLHYVDQPFDNEDTIELTILNRHGDTEIWMDFDKKGRLRDVGYFVYQKV